VLHREPHADPEHRQSSEETESQSTLAVMVVEVPLEELAVRCSEGAPTCLRLPPSTSKGCTTRSAASPRTRASGPSGLTITVFRQMGVAIFDYNEASADAARGASSFAVIMLVTTAATMSAHRADNYTSSTSRTHSWRTDPNFLKAFGMSNLVS